MDLRDAVLASRLEVVALVVRLLVFGHLVVAWQVHLEALRLEVECSQLHMDAP